MEAEIDLGTETLYIINYKYPLRVLFTGCIKA